MLHLMAQKEWLYIKWMACWVVFQKSTFNYLSPSSEYALDERWRCTGMSCSIHDGLFFMILLCVLIVPTRSAIQSAPIQEIHIVALGNSLVEVHFMRAFPGSLLLLLLQLPVALSVIVIAPGDSKLYNSGRLRSARQCNVTAALGFANRCIIGRILFSLNYPFQFNPRRGPNFVNF